MRESINPEKKVSSGGCSEENDEDDEETEGLRDTFILRWQKRDIDNLFMNYNKCRFYYNFKS